MKISLIIFKKNLNYNERNHNYNDNVFQPKCGTEIFKTFRRQFDLENDEYLEYMNKINDPTLKYVSVYLVQYYKDGYKYFGKSTKPYRSGACRYLIKWLHEKRDLFTYGKMCQKKLNLWNDKIVKLWEMLLKNSKYFDNEQKPWCDNPLLSFETTFPPYVSMHKCAEIISKEPCSKVLDCPQVPTECNCSVKEIPVNSLETAPLPETNHPPDTDRTKNLAVTSGFTAVGTLGTLFFLYRVINKQ
ncbi:hypothetical protein PVBG_05838 [Plasmodium vivax Brazil I]|uniref:Uncharacterized protein n=1 Tax=Plasmodium vivax (strain Brazil I) TaxID=1033975 RepID=A0A0J9T1B2_PLAV1|nr:hypothetical protein PVBG_05838 [Plasmodium vivax Brazil I]